MRLPNPSFHTGRTPEIYSPERLDVEMPASAEDRDASLKQEDKMITDMLNSEVSSILFLTPLQEHWQP